MGNFADHPAGLDPTIGAIGLVFSVLLGSLAKPMCCLLPLLGGLRRRLIPRPSEGVFRLSSVLATVPRQWRYAFYAPGHA